MTTEYQSYFDFLPQKQAEEAKIDYDLQAALYHNDLGGNIKDIKSVMAFVEGDHDGPAYYWIVELTGAKKQYAFIYGGCDYTGWDCQSDCDIKYCDTTSEAIGMVETAAKEYYESDRAEFVRQQLSHQLANGLGKSWRADVAGDMPDVPIVKC